MSDALAPRRVAANVVGRVLRQGAYSNVLLTSALVDLSTPEAARAKGLVYGTLRGIKKIDRALESGARRSLDDLETEVVDTLRIAAFEILFSDVPSPVAVSVGVDLVKEFRPKAAGIANAILRRVSELDPQGEPILEFPDWLVTSLRRIWDDDVIADFTKHSSTEPARTARSSGGDPANLEPVPGITGAYRLEPGPLPTGFVIQDAASVAVGNVVDVQPGMTVLDLAAAPGGKTAHLVDRVGENGVVIAADSHRRRTRSAARRVPRAHWVQADASDPPFRPGSFDRILLDAPCSGLGTLRRRPEILGRVDVESVTRMAAAQRQMVEAAQPLVRPGGSLIYSVCTVTPEETIDVVEGRGFRSPAVVGEDLGTGRLLAPHTTGTDAMFVAEWIA